MTCALPAPSEMDVDPEMDVVATMEPPEKRRAVKAWCFFF